MEVGKADLISGGKSMVPNFELHQRRSEKGKRLSNRVTQHDNGFHVRSETQGAKVYNVTSDNGQWMCSCDDFRFRSERLRMMYDFNCGHILAVQFALKFGTVHGTKSVAKTRAAVVATQSNGPRRRSLGRR